MTTLGSQNYKLEINTGNGTGKFTHNDIESDTGRLYFDNNMKLVYCAGSLPTEVKNMLVMHKFYNNPGESNG
jgi:hypothetical protein